MFDFTELIEDFEVEQVYSLEESPGYYDYENGGIYVEGGISEVAITGAVVPLTTKDKEGLEYKDNHAYVQNSRKLYSKNKLEYGSKILHKGKVYTIQGSGDYSDFDVDLGIYIIRRNDT